MGLRLRLEEKTMTKIDVVSGFLGAGKTTLIRAILNDIPHEGSIDFRDTENGHMRRLSLIHI